ncbi:helix-turn-helix transcriptional regulator [Aerococcaceae bacterium zg-ZUI334]|uniref:helix-turn-helix domain-containing protein n=1 Tax=Aerococcaceae bacterium zg-252 TaxID=2796928 RepID=UPI001B9D9341|nr:helix-turn-helix transcriptional regulator [Aerococcaceae bacterium zg-ZUI334]
MVEKFTLKQIRNIKGLTQAELAEKVGITERTIANYEKDVTALQKADYIVVYRIAKVLDVNTGDIFLGTESEKPKLTI